MALMAVFLSVNLVACSSSNDDEPNENGGNNTNVVKKLIEITENEDGEITILKLIYDKDGKLFSTNGYCNESYIWDDNYIVEENNDKTGSPVKPCV